MACIVVFLQVPLATSVPHDLPLSRWMWQVIIVIILILVSGGFSFVCFVFLPLGLKEGEGVFVCFSIFFFFWWLKPHLVMLWLISLAEYFRLRFRLMFQICMHCLHFPGIWMLVPFPRNPTLISKIIIGLVTIRDMNLCIKCIGLPHWPAIVLLCPVCVCVMSGCHRKLQRKTLKADHPFLHALF